MCHIWGRWCGFPSRPPALAAGQGTRSGGVDDELAVSPRHMRLRFASESRIAGRFFCSSGLFLGGVPFAGCAGETLPDSGRTDPDRVRPAGRIRHEQLHEHDAPDARVLRLARANARRYYEAMRNASADEASDFSASGIGNGIIASSRSSAVTVATRTFGAISTGSSAGATTAAGAPAGRPIGADRA
jgi:hypothetical protein